MSVTAELDRPPSASRDDAGSARRLRTETAAVRLSFTWFGVRRSLTPAQKAEAAETFGAAGKFFSAGKKLFDTRHPRMKAVTTVRRQATEYFQGMSLPFPELAVRLVRRGDVAAIETRLGRLAEELSDAVEQLDEALGELRAAARESLGRLFSPGDYPASLGGLFAMSWDYPSVEPPEYLRRLAPRLYAEECRRVAARFDEAVELAEQMFFRELGELVSHLNERLTGLADGKPKVFRDSAVDHLREFLERFRRLDIGSCDQLDQLILQATELVQGITPQKLRESSSLRRDVASELARLQATVDGALVDRPRRNLMRRGGRSDS